MNASVIRVRKNGSSLCCSLPSAIVHELGLTVGDSMVLRMEGNLLVMERIPVEQLARPTVRQNDAGLEEHAMEAQKQIIPTSDRPPKDNFQLDEWVRQEEVKRIRVGDRLLAIQKVVAEEHRLRIADLKAKNNSKNVVFPRQIAMFLSRELVGASLPEIGRAFGFRHHTTVLHSVKKIREGRKADHELNRLINKLIGEAKRICG